ncbi:hypothetical protein PHSY_006159 [Pseudozyma hubeiensis SY62]|uniref:Uncharacterized protein n=1 Tax=Pseudozyma hubeiensis (strain SY62) TaxID=1305764 RepID=R9PKB7_PSEHS|nr:hypothetical protein PHSY_006159 [Pseudozyma hubeiensis SY62]GAC98565.1 hypothetical protein PHSY_006159 [Pseudozyma hubeiensis SY62]
MVKRYVAAISRKLREQAVRLSAPKAPFLLMDDVVFASLCREPVLGGPSSFKSNRWYGEQSCNHRPRSSFGTCLREARDARRACWLVAEPQTVASPIETAAASTRQIDRLRLETFLRLFGQAEIEMSKRIPVFSCAVTNERFGICSDTANRAVTSWQDNRIVPVSPGLARSSGGGCNASGSGSILASRPDSARSTSLCSGAGTKVVSSLRGQ